MDVLITGGLGFLGHHFARHHVAAGDKVLIVDNLSNHVVRKVNGADLIEDEVELWAAFAMLKQRRYDLAYHFAAPVGGRMKIDHDPMFNAASLGIDATFFRYALRNVPLVVYPSSSAVYGVRFQGKDGVALQEGMYHPANPNWFAPDQMYGFTKFVGEMLAWKCADYGLNTLCLRPFSGYGEGQSFDYPVPAIARRAANREDPLVIWGSGEQTRDFIHVEDIVRITAARLAHPDPVKGYETLNLGTGFPISFNTIAKTCAHIVGYAPTLQTDESKPVGVQRRVAATGRMKLFGTPQVSLREGLERVIEDVKGR